MENKKTEKLYLCKCGAEVWLKYPEDSVCSECKRIGTFIELEEEK